MPSSRLSKPLIAVTAGDPGGIGPEIVRKALKNPRLSKNQNFLIIDERAAIRSIDKAIELLKKGDAAALVTGPVSKAAINKAGTRFSGHTEYLAEKFGVEFPVMMFAGGPIKAAIVTRHIPLKKVSSVLDTGKIIKTAELTYKFLKKYFRIKKPRIGVVALNPHAGEEGLLGGEEREIIKPAVDKLKSQIPLIKGPLPADAAFHDLYNKKYDCLVCMYHDQAMIPVKMLARDTAVNITLGLPFIRTSPVHGTAFDIAGKGIADPSSMIEAMNLAARLAEKC